MATWFSKLLGTAPAPAPPPEGFRRISELPCSTAKDDHMFLILDWRLAPNPPHEYGSILVWLEVKGKSQQFYLSKKEALHFESVKLASTTHVRAAKSRGCWYLLPVDPRKEKSISRLPPPPKVFPPAPQ
jgi:hypothetical protein